MKPLIIITLLTIVIILGGWLTLSTLESESQRLLEKLSLLEEDIESMNWNAAENKLEEFGSIWKKTSSFWSMLVDHYEIDNIELTLARLSSYIKNENKSEALSHMSALKALVKHIPAKESFNLKNIL